MTSGYNTALVKDDPGVVSFADLGSHPHRDACMCGQGLGGRVGVGSQCEEGRRVAADRQLLCPPVPRRVAPEAPGSLQEVPAPSGQDQADSTSRQRWRSPHTVQKAHAGREANCCGCWEIHRELPQKLNTIQRPHTWVRSAKSLQDSPLGANVAAEAGEARRGGRGEGKRQV